MVPSLDVLCLGVIPFTLKVITLNALTFHHIFVKIPES